MTNKLYKVGANDTLTKIIAQFYGKVDDEKLKMVMDANGITNPNLITIGQEIKLPGDWGDAPAEQPKKQVVPPVAKSHSPTVIQNDLALLDPTFRVKVEKTIADAKEAGLPVEIYETGRIDIRQRYLFEKGYSKISTVGMHGYGGATDIVFIKHGEPTWDEPNKGDWDKLWTIARKNGMYTVGTWDRAHFQAVPVSQQPEWYHSHQAFHKRINS